MSVKDVLQSNRIVLVIVEKEKYSSEMFQIIKDIQSIIPKICYVSLTHPCLTLANRLELNQIKTENFHFIDVLTSSTMQVQNSEKITFVSNPSALTEVSIAFSKSMDKCDVAIIDAISTMLIYSEEMEVIRFTHNVTAKTRMQNKKAVFIALKEDTNTNLIKDLHMFVDKVIEI